MGHREGDVRRTALTVDGRRNQRESGGKPPLSPCLAGSWAGGLDNIAPVG